MEDPPLPVDPRAVIIERSSPTLLSIPVEARRNIYRELFLDLISELSDNLFGVFHIYDHMYDYTASHMESHVGATGLTAVLRVNRQLSREALEVLCENAEFVVSVMGDDDGDDREREDVRFGDASRHFGLARNLKLNLFPRDDETNERFVGRLRRTLGAIHWGEGLRSLKVCLVPHASVGAESMEKILVVLAGLKKHGSPIQIYLGNVTRRQLSSRRLTVLLDAIGAISRGRGRNHLSPDHWDGEDEDVESDYSEQFEEEGESDSDGEVKTETEKELVQGDNGDQQRLQFTGPSLGESFRLMRSQQ